MNPPLARALRAAGVNEVDVAARLGVDPKTVSNWIRGRLPYPRHRAALVQLTGWSMRDLWPEVHYRVDPAVHAEELRVVYPRRAAVPADTWASLFARAECDIAILAYSALFLAEDFVVMAILRDKVQAGVQVRIALGQSDGRNVRNRGAEEEIGDGMAARIGAALVGFRPVIEAGAEIRVHDTVLYGSVYTADDELLVNTHVYGHPGSHSPVLRLSRQSGEGLAATYFASFERVWATARELGK